MYLNIAAIADLIDETASSEDAEESKPAPDIFEVVLKKLKIEGRDSVAIGDTPYDASAAGKAGIATIGVLCGGSPKVRCGQPVASMCTQDRPRCSPGSTNPCLRIEVDRRSSYIAGPLSIRRSRIGSDGSAIGSRPKVIFRLSLMFPYVHFYTFLPERFLCLCDISRREKWDYECVASDSGR